MHILFVQIRVKPECIDAFRDASLANARATVQEAGCLRFDVIQQQDDPTRFALYEAYRHADDQASHRETAHYAKWRDTVTDLMAEPRIGTKYTDAFWTK